MGIFEGTKHKAIRGEMATFSEIQDAFLFVSSEKYGMHSAILCRDTGRIYYHSELGGIDEIDEADLDWDTCIDIPHKNDLDLGQELVFEFVERHLSDEYHIVQQIFRYRGAYARFKAFLEQKGYCRVGTILKIIDRKRNSVSGARTTR